MKSIFLGYFGIMTTLKTANFFYYFNESQLAIYRAIQFNLWYCSYSTNNKFWSLSCYQAVMLSSWDFQYSLVAMRRLKDCFTFNLIHPFPSVAFHRIIKGIYNRSKPCVAVVVFFRLISVCFRITRYKIGMEFR